MQIAELLSKQEGEYKALLEVHRSEWDQFKNSPKGLSDTKAHHEFLNRQGAELKNLGTIHEKQREALSQAIDIRNARNQEQGPNNLDIQKEEQAKKQQQEVKQEYQQHIKNAEKQERDETYNQNNIAKNDAMDKVATRRQETNDEREIREAMEQLRDNDFGLEHEIN